MIKTVVTAGFIYPVPSKSENSDTEVQSSQQIKMLNCLIGRSFQPSQSPEHSVSSSSYRLVVILLFSGVPLWICIFKGCGKGAVRSYQQSCRAETRPICLKKGRQCHAMCGAYHCLWPEPCCVVSTCFLFSRWYHKIGALATLILRSLFVMCCFVLLGTTRKNMLSNWKQLSLQKVYLKNNS